MEDRWKTALDFSTFPDKINFRWIALGNGATAARLTLDQVIGVRIPVPQPLLIKKDEFELPL